MLPSDRLSEEAKGYGHYPDFLDKQLMEQRLFECIMPGCKGKTAYYCPDCSAFGKLTPLCLPYCFKEYHEKEIYLDEKNNKDEYKVKYYKQWSSLSRVKDYYQRDRIKIF